MKLNSIASLFILVIIMSCHTNKKDNQLKQTPKNVTARDILGDSNYLAISYGGYRMKSRDSQPTLPQLKNDMRILSAMGIKMLRTYNVQLDHAKNVLKAIRELQSENPEFEMYVMLGAWIDCLNAWTDQAPDHSVESPQNEGEIARAVALANQYPDIVKILAVGNEAMVKWATKYYVEPWVILKWVNHLQELKNNGDLPKDLWITSSDDFSSWGGGDALYHTEDLKKLAKAVDYVSIHTYPYHNTHYNPQFWKVPAEDVEKLALDQINNAMTRAIDFSKAQYDSVSNYMASIGVVKPIHIGETGWATVSKGFYGPNGSRATDEYKQGLYYNMMRDWTNKNKISCFYFEAFNEQWKDAEHPNGSENHFGLFKIDGTAKYPIWDLVDKGVFKGLTRNGNAIKKSYDGNLDALLLDVLVPPRADGAVVHSMN